MMNKSRDITLLFKKFVLTERKSVADVLEALDNRKVCVDEFNDRLKNQKIIYLLQEYGLKLGYTYSWYLYGPYCKEVTKDTYGEAEESATSDLSDSEKIKIRAFKNKFGDNLDDPEWLEVAASLMYLQKKKYLGQKLAAIKDDLIDDMAFGLKHFHPHFVLDVINELEEKQFLK